MINSIGSIVIKGGCFEHETKLPLFDDGQKKRKFCLVYGKNGSGKTTISTAFSKIAGNEEDVISTATLLDSNGNPAAVDPNNANAVFVFNEKFVNEKIRIKEEGLNSILLVGKKKEADEKIEELTPIYKELDSNYQKQIEIVKEYSNSNNSKSPEYYKLAMINKLKGENSWSSKDSALQGKKQNTRVTEETWKRLIEIKTDKSRDELVLDYDKYSNELETAKSGTKIIETPVNLDFAEANFEDEARRILAEKIEKPELSEREKYLFSIFSDKDGHAKLVGSKTFFANPENNRCPFCFQDVTREYTDQLILSVEKILNEKANEHLSKLGQLSRAIYTIDLGLYEGELDADIIKSVSETLQILNSAIEEFNIFVEQKQTNIYKEVVLPELNLNEKFDAFIDAAKRLEADRIKHNEIASDTQAIVNKLIETNDLIAMYDISPLYESYKKQLNEMELERTKLKELEEKTEEYKKQLDKLEEEKKGAEIAEKSINDDLRYIFYSKDRLFIDYKDNKYVLYSRGKSVDPNHISVGERNAIGLSYFFNTILENKEEETAFDHPYLIVIDDPISSFDMENKVGVLSYLRHALSKFALGNESTRVLILTHDLQTLFDLSKIVDEITAEYCSKFSIPTSQKKNLAVRYELEQRDFKESNNIERRHEYTTLMEQVYEYAKNPLPEHSMLIGNMMRKMLEAFGTFVYKKGISEVSTDPAILEEFEEPYRSYFQNLMYRLVLHGTSHMEDRVKTLDDIDFYDFISDSEKQRTAKDILCFIYKLNPKHLLAHLSTKPSAESDIKQWCKDNIETT